MFLSRRKFLCQTQKLRAAEGQSLYHKDLGCKTIKLPVAHKQGRFYLDLEASKKVFDKGQVLLCYEDNPNGSTADIAGLCSENGKILGLMPHPERAVDLSLNEGEDGQILLRSFLSLCL